MNAETLARIERALRDDIARAGDNVMRARRSFRGQRMDSLYGESGQTCQAILDGYEAELSSANAAIKDFADAK